MAIGRLVIMLASSDVLLAIDLAAASSQSLPTMWLRKATRSVDSKDSANPRSAQAPSPRTLKWTRLRLLLQDYVSEVSHPEDR